MLVLQDSKSMFQTAVPKGFPINYFGWIEDFFIKEFLEHLSLVIWGLIDDFWWTIWKPTMDNSALFALLYGLYVSKKSAVLKLVSI